MLDHLPYFDAHFSGRGDMMFLTTNEEEQISDVYAYGGKTQKNKQPSRINYPIRGGKINVVCEEHRNESTVCCDNKYLQNSNVVMCEYCLIWYHYKCEGITQKDLNAIESFKC